MKFLNENGNSNGENNKITIILKNRRFFKYINYTVIYWSVALYIPHNQTISMDLQQVYERIQKLIGETIKLFNSIINFIKHTPWHYNNDIYIIYKTLCNLMQCSHNTLYLKNEM
eukprot:321129_1